VRKSRSVSAWHVLDTPRAFRLLEYLLRQHPKALSKRELLDHV
jgi:DNA-binding winged helix-turn-helix (wHTH) protein